MSENNGEPPKKYKYNRKFKPKTEFKNEKEHERYRKRMARRRRNQMRLYNQRSRSKKRRKLVAERAKIGDEPGMFVIFITCNNKAIRYVTKASWRLKGLDVFYKNIEENRRQVLCPRFMDVKNKKLGDPIWSNTSKYEIILVQYLPEDQDGTRYFRNDFGKFVDYYIVDYPNRAIIAKDYWYVDETYYVYGYHPVRDRKTCSFIYENILLKDLDKRHDMKKVRLHKRRLFIETADDFDLIICPTTQSCETLYNTLFSLVEKNQCENVIFLGHIPESQFPRIERMITNKTGWPPTACDMRRL